MSFPKLIDQRAEVAAALAELGVRHGDRVLIMLPDGPGFAESFAGAVHHDALLLPVSHYYQRTTLPQPPPRQVPPAGAGPTGSGPRVGRVRRRASTLLDMRTSTRSHNCRANPSRRRRTVDDHTVGAHPTGCAVRTGVADLAQDMRHDGRLLPIITLS
ncbi:MAG: AMP-binding protein [Pseudonocardiaceae bacterium]